MQKVSSETKKAIVIGQAWYRGAVCNVVITHHGDEQMTEREIRRTETILAAIQATNWDGMEKWDTCMVWVEGQPLSFPVGFDRQGIISVLTVIAKPYAEPKTNGTYTWRVAVN